MQRSAEENFCTEQGVIQVRVSAIHDTCRSHCKTESYMICTTGTTDLTQTRQNKE